MAKDGPTSAGEIAYQTLIFLMAGRMKKAGVLSDDDIAGLEAEATSLLKGADFSAGAPETFQVEYVEASLAELQEGIAIIRRAPNKAA
jgi:hypothetical protein